MIKLEIQYKRQIGYGTIRVDVPSTYSEMSATQFLAAVRVTQGLIDQAEFIKTYFGLHDMIFAKLDGYQLYKITELVEQIDSSKASHDDFYIQRLPGDFFAPNAKLNGMSFQQFMVIDTYFGWHIYTDKPAYLDLMIAAMYLRTGESFFPEAGETLADVEAHAKRMADLDRGTKMAIMLNWTLIKGWLSHAYGDLFPMGEPDSSKKNTKKQRPTNWLDVFDAFVGDNIPHMDSYKAMPCMDAFRILNKKIKEAKKR